MKKLIFGILAVSLTLPAFARGGGRGGGHSSGGHASGGTSHSSNTSKAATGAGAKASHERVSSYSKGNGTHVVAHGRSTKDATKDNNWSTKGNVNPETGKAGTK